MNRFRKIVTVVTTLLAINFASAQDDVQISFDKLPQKAQDFIKTHYAVADIASVWKDMEFLKVDDYTTVFNDGTKIEFYPNGDWKEVKSGGTTIPTKIIPSSIEQYISKNYPNKAIKDIKKKRYGYEVELVGGLELEFNSKGKFVKIDD